MSDVGNTGGNITLPEDAVKQLTDNVNTAKQLLGVYDALEKLGIPLPGSKEQLSAVMELSQTLIDNFGVKK